MPNRLTFPASWPAGAARFKSILRLFWTLDLLLIGGFVLARVLVYTRSIDEIPHMLNIDREYTLPETFNYLKWCLCALFLAIAFAKTRVPLFGCLALVFAMLFADDAFLIHETLGWTVADAFGIPTAISLDPKQIGEVLVFGAMGVIALALIVTGYLLSPPSYRVFAHRYLAVIVGLAIVGVFLDAAHHISWDLTTGSLRNYMTFALTLLEDGGEMLLASVAVALSAGAARATAQSPAPSRSAARPAR